MSLDVLSVWLLPMSLGVVSVSLAVAHVSECFECFSDLPMSLGVFSVSLAVTHVSKCL